MKFSKSLFVLACSSILTISCKETSNEPKKTAVSEKIVTAEKAVIPTENLETASFNIEGMTCAMGCAKTIEKELSGLEGVQEATVDFENKTATVAFDSTKQTPESLTKVVEAAADGQTYKVSNIKIIGKHS